MLTERSNIAMPAPPQSQTEMVTIPNVICLGHEPAVATAPNTSLKPTTQQVASKEETQLNFNLSPSCMLAPVLQVKHYTKTLFSLVVTKPTGMVFRTGEHAMIGLIINGKPVFRPYFICSPSSSGSLEFYSAKIPYGALTSFLHKSSTLNSIIIDINPIGSLLLSALAPGERLLLFCAGVAIGPAVSILSEPEVYRTFKQVIIVQTCRQVDGFQYLKEKIAQLKSNPSLKALAKGKARIYTSTTRERSPFMGRIQHLITSGKLTSDLGGRPLNANDRFMVCGPQAMVTDVTTVLTAMGYKEGSVSNPQAFVCESVVATTETNQVSLA
ncbi:MAG: ferredoxin--NADP reductase [Candidatus Hodgkinia cicadicola]